MVSFLSWPFYCFFLYKKTPALGVFSVFSLEKTRSQKQRLCKKERKRAKDTKSNSQKRKKTRSGEETRKSITRWLSTRPPKARKVCGSPLLDEN